MGTSSKANTLLIASTQDIASMNICNSLMERNNWNQLTPRVYSNNINKNLFLWVQTESLLTLDEPHELIKSREDLCSLDEGLDFSEVIFLSRHSAASGISSLTVHPIGVPWLAHSQRGRYGGKGGRCSPPNQRMSSLFRSLMHYTKENNASDIFQVTMEATHHGPYCSIPTCFIEIGSNATTWDVPLAGEIWADVLQDEFQLHSHSDSEITSVSASMTEIEIETADIGTDTATDTDLNINTNEECVFIIIGGSHYVPKAYDAAKLGMNIGHMLANYSLSASINNNVDIGTADGTPPTSEEILEGNVPTWRSTILEAINSTNLTWSKSATSTLTIFVYLDKKIAKTPEKLKEVTSFLESLGQGEVTLACEEGVREEWEWKGSVIKWSHNFNDIKKMYNAFIEGKRKEESSVISHQSSVK
jgi:D-aminoacyl-tRNA deacylase